MISADEEAELMVLIRNGDQAALEKLVLANLRFVISVAKQYQNQGLSFPDLVNEGNLGLIRAANRFDETRGFKFISYAVWWIRQAISQAISEQTRVVRLPLNRVSSIKKISKAIPLLEQELHREPTDAEIAEHLEMSDDEVNIAITIRSRQISFDKPLSHEKDDEFSLHQVIHTGNLPPPDDNMMRESTVKNLNRALAKLSEREASIISMYYGLSGTPTYTLQEIAYRCDMSSERVRQIKNQGLVKLKQLLTTSVSLFQD